MTRLAQLKGSVIKPGLETVTELLRRLSDPQLQFKSVHIAGTNGKGSCAAMLREILMKSGYRTALYSSPHLHRFNERVTMDRREISDEDIERLDAVVGDACDGIEPTYFEYTTAMAFKYFAERKPDIAIVEVGLGGRLDATNLVDPLATVITPISMDHQEFLGDDIKSVASEKAGIMKSGVKAVVSRQQREALDVIEGRAIEVGAPVLLEGRDFDTVDSAYPTFDFKGRRVELEKLRCGLIGRHQVQNSSMALATAEVLVEAGFDISRGALRGGVAGVEWPGRLELIDGRPPVLLDGTHNPGGARVLARALSEDFSGKKVRLVMGMQVTKDLDIFLKTLAPHIVAVHATPLRDVQYYDIEKVAAVASALGLAGSAHDSVSEALTEARAAVGENDLVLVAGSLYLVGEVAELLGRER